MKNFLLDSERWRGFAGVWEIESCEIPIVVMVDGRDKK